MNPRLIRHRLALLTALVFLAPAPAYCFYNPSTGRWISRDPVEEEGGKNLFAFLRNEAIHGWDAVGLSRGGPEALKCYCCSPKTSG